MKTISKKVEQFLLSNTVWIYLTLLTLYSAIRIMTFAGEQSSLMYLSGRKWLEFLSFAAANIFVFLPLLLYTTFRNKIKSSKHIYPPFLWIYCFLIHPIVIGSLDLQNFFFPVQIDGVIICMMAFIFALVELALALPKQLYYFFDMKPVDLAKSPLFQLLFMTILFIVFRSGDDCDSSYLGDLYTIALLFTYYIFYNVNHFFLIRRIYKEKGLIIMPLPFL